MGLELKDYDIDLKPMMHTRKESDKENDKNWPNHSINIQYAKVSKAMFQ